MKNILFGFFCILMLSQCCEEGGDDTKHRCAGKVQHAITEETLSDIRIHVGDRTCFLSPVSCKQLDFEKFTKEKGDFNFIYFSCCDVNVTFELTDSLEEVLGECYRWEIEDLNGNPVQMGGCDNIRDQLQTVRETEYNFLVSFQPQLFVRFKPNEVEGPELQKIEVEKLGISADSLTFLTDVYDILALEDAVEIKLTYANDSTATQFLEYNYVESCNKEVTIDI